MNLQGVRTSQTRPGSKGDSLTLVCPNKHSQLIKRKLVYLDHRASEHSLCWMGLQGFRPLMNSPTVAGFFGRTKPPTSEPRN